jgi:D-alanyl-D-alanine carboxypeptidase/D-alanyl-D-alanine-endopeptidase (penicillin-binding protein 4)
MKQLGVLFLFSLIGVTCSRPPALSPETGQRELTKTIHYLITHSGLKTNLGVKVVSLKTGKTLYAVNEDHLFNPASNNKLFTSLAALKLLSPQFQFVTTVWIDSALAILDTIPRLTLKGGGDPDLSVDDLRQLAETVAEKIKVIDTLILDPSIFDDRVQGNGWMWDEGDRWYSAQVTGLGVNDNCVDITVTPAEANQPPEIIINPNTDYVTINNQAITLEDTTGLQKLRIKRRWEVASNTIDITGNILTSDEPKTYYRNVEDPMLFTGYVFKELLAEAGTIVMGPMMKDTLRTPASQIAVHQSLPLREANVNLMKKSDNLTAESFVKMIGHVTTDKSGSWETGILAIKSFLFDEVGLDTNQFKYVDGSGVSRYNYCSPSQLIEVLRYGFQDYTINAEYLAALPTGGWDGTLKKRLRSEVINRRIRAKTGTLEGVSCLSGYVYTADDEPLAFSILINGYVGEAKPYQTLQDELCTLLATYSRK